MDRGSSDRVCGIGSNWRIVQLSFLLVAVIVLLSSGCGSKGGVTLSNVQRQIAAMPCPPGVSVELWDILTAELTTQIEKHASASPLVAGPPLDDLSIVDDLSAVEQPLGSVRLRWSYKNTGDYDQNSETNISDLTPIGRHFNKTPASGDWNQASTADGDLNHEVNISDITPIGRCFRQTVTEYWVEFNASGAPGSVFEHRDSVSFDQGEPNANDWLTFDHTLSLGQSGYYRVVPYYFEERGIPGTPVYFALNQAPDAVLTADPQAGRTPLVVNFDASQSHDPENLALTFEWDWEGDGVWDHQSTTPQQQHEYTEEGEYAPIVRVRDSKGSESTDQLAVYCFAWQLHEVLENVGNAFALIGGRPAFLFEVADEDDPPQMPVTTWYARANVAEPQSSADWDFSVLALPVDDGDGGLLGFGAQLMFEHEGRPAAMLNLNAPFREFWFGQATTSQPQDETDWSLSKIVSWQGDETGRAAGLSIGDRVYLFSPNAAEIRLIRSLVAEPQGPQDWEVTKVADTGDETSQLVFAAYTGGQFLVTFTDQSQSRAVCATSTELNPSGPQDWQLTFLDLDRSSIAGNVVTVDNLPVWGMASFTEDSAKDMRVASGLVATPQEAAEWRLVNAQGEIDGRSYPLLTSVAGGCMAVVSEPRATTGKQLVALYPPVPGVPLTNEPWLPVPINPEHTGFANGRETFALDDLLICMFWETSLGPPYEYRTYFASANLPKKYGN